MGDPSSRRARRRDVLRGIGVIGATAATSVLIAACGGGASTPTAASAGTTSNAAPAATATPASSAASAPTAAAAPTTAPQPAATSAPATGNPIKLTYWKSPHSATEQQLWQPILKQFQDKNPGIQVVHTVIPWGDFDAKFTAAFASGEPPDVFYMPDEWIPKYASQGQMADLSPIIKSEAITNNYPAVFWSSSTYQGKTYGVPFLAVVQAFLINQSLFEAEGVAIPKTWDDIRAAAKKLTNPSKGTYGLSMDSQNAPPPVLMAGGATVFSKDLHQIGANTPGGIQAWTVAYQNIGAEDKSMVPLSFTADQLTALNIKGNIGMMWQEESSIVAEFRKQAPNMKLDVIPVPKVDGTDGHDSAWYNVGYMCIAAQTPHLQQATDLLNFLDTKAVQQSYVITGVNLIPAMNNVKAPNLDPVVAKYLAFIPEGVGPTASTHWPDVKQKLQQASQAVISGQKTAKQALDEFASNLNPELDGN